MRRLHAFLIAVLYMIPTFSRAETPDDWAYKPVAKASVPKSGFANPIDAFLAAKLAEANLAYATPADKATLLRRVTFDLSGLPPTPEEIAAFLKDDTEKAYEKVVDRLLASPHFGERVAIWWLDVARFAETDGFKSDDHRPNAWRYRDYVIASFNADKPYDRFVKEQIAGDELDANNTAATIATGFLRHFPDEYNAVNLEQRRQEILNDITDTTAAAFLGVTLGCAKCHDHKTDPITHVDYYRFQSFFAGVWPTEKPLLSQEAITANDTKTKAWEAKTEELRQQMAELEKPFREKAEKKERSRFQEEYVSLIDIPSEKRSPWQKQIAAMVEKQVYSAKRFNPSLMKGTVKEKWEGMSKRMTELTKDKPADPPTAMGMTDVGAVAPPQHRLKRGDWRKPGEVVEPGYLSAFDDRDAEPVTSNIGTTGRRTALANWIADDKNPLASRVIVNRIWQHLFGRGIVASSSDFGLTGDRPTHPELLDWLAQDFVVNARSMKHVYRQIAMTTAYRQSGIGNESHYSKDPENKLLWQMPRKRLDGESLRDAILAVTGTLNAKMGGPSVYPELPSELKGTAGWKVSEDPKERSRRSVYVYVKRNLRYPLFSLFDSPDRSETCARRFTTTTAPQALTLLNDSLVLSYAKTFAERVIADVGSDSNKVIDRTMFLAVGRKPTTEEVAKLNLFFGKTTGTTIERVTDLCHSVLNLNEFLYID